MSFKKRKTFRLYEIRRALENWKNIWLLGRDLEIDWHTFKIDLQNAAKPRRRKK